MNTAGVFECRMCGRCCEGKGGIVLAARDRVRLAVHLGMTEESMLERYAETVGGRVRLVTGDGGSCVFYDPQTGCTVHQARPDVCRAWPFFRGNLVDEESWRMALTDCPGIVAEAGHAAFRSLGAAYVRSLGVDESDPDVPTALTGFDD